jgi:hypothetical protein
MRRDDIQFGGTTDALRWAIGVCARNGYVSPSITRMMGGARATAGSMSILELHGQAAAIVAIVDRLPEAYQAAIWFRAGVLPWDVMRALAVVLAPHIVRQMPTGTSDREAVVMALLNTAGAKGASKRAIAKRMQVRVADGVAWTNLVAEKMDAFGKIAEAQVDLEMRERGLLSA